MTSTSTQTTPVQWLPFMCPPIPFQFGPPFFHSLNPRISQMSFFSHNFNLNPMLSVLQSRVPDVHCSQVIQPIGAESADVPKESNVCLQKSYLCLLCISNPFSSSKLKEFKRHLNTHSSLERPFVCKICKKSYPYRCLWRNHIVIHMAVKALVPSVDSQSLNKSTESDKSDVKQCEVNPYKCQKCGFVSKSKTDFVLHSKLDCNTAPLKCSDCDYQTYTRTKLERHEITHIRDRPYVCSECNSTFSQSGSLKGHLLKVHKITELMIRCPYCSLFEAKNFGLLKTHIEKLHKDSSFDYTLVEF